MRKQNTFTESMAGTGNDLVPIMHDGANETGNEQIYKMTPRTNDSLQLKAVLQTNSLAEYKFFR